MEPETPPSPAPQEGNSPSRPESPEMGQERYMFWNCSISKLTYMDVRIMLIYIVISLNLIDFDCRFCSSIQCLVLDLLF